MLLMYILFLVVLPAIIVIWFGTATVMRRLQERALTVRCAEKRAIVLSYDDGPGAILTEQLADLLRRRNLLATFFVIGQRADQYSDHVASLLRDGHDVGGHTQDHTNAWKVTPWRAVMDMRNGHATLRRLGVHPHLFRPPYGKATLATLIFGLVAKLHFAYWSVDTRDSWEKPRSIAAVLAMIKRQGGGVVLMHDCDAPPRSMNPQAHPCHILALTEAIIDFAATEGFSIIRFSDLLLQAVAASSPGTVHV